MSLSDKYFQFIEKLSVAAFGDRSFPDAAFIVEKGAEKDDSGKTLQKYRHLPHHNKNAKDPNENSTVDIPHLRNALARVGQVTPIKESKAGYVSRARTHLQRHAKALLKSDKPETKAQAELLCKEFNIDTKGE